MSWRAAIGENVTRRFDSISRRWYERLEERVSERHVWKAQEPSRLSARNFAEGRTEDNKETQLSYTLDLMPASGARAAESPLLAHLYKPSQAAGTARQPNLYT